MTQGQVQLLKEKYKIMNPAEFESYVHKVFGVHIAGKFTVTTPFSKILTLIQQAEKEKRTKQKQKRTEGN